MNEKVIYKRILVVDDNDDIRKILVELLETIKKNSRGKIFLIEDACNGQEAWRKINKDKKINYDLVITDVIMPEMDGITLKNKIEEQFPETKIIVLSGNVFPPKNCSYFFRKPFSFADFVQTVELLTS